MDYAHPANPELRLSNDDRSNAVAALATHQTDGRITASEYSERAAAASAAQTWGDLSTLFVDLPQLSDGAATGGASVPGDTTPGAGAAEAAGLGASGLDTAGIGSAGPTVSQPSAAFNAGVPNAAGATRTGAAGVGVSGQAGGDDGGGRYDGAGYGGRGPYGRDRGWYDRHGRRPLGGRTGVAIVSAAPLVAVLLFFLTGFAWGFNWSWLWFLMVPIAGAIVYAPSWYDDDRR